MDHQAKGNSCCRPNNGSCCKIEAMITVDERGQMVLPKDAREKAGIKAGDKLALITWEKNGAVCCLSLIKTEELSGMARNILRPLVKEIF